MPYYRYCISCNKDGSYKNVDINCGKCDGTGNDWRDNRELEGFHKRFGLKIEDLIRERTLTSDDGTKFFYKERIPTIKEEREELKQFLKVNKATIPKEKDHPNFTIKFKGTCPICEGENFLGYKNDYGLYILKCIKCDGVPATCNGTSYLHSGDNNGQDCEYCGDSPAEARTHTVMSTY